MTLKAFSFSMVSLDWNSMQDFLRLQLWASEHFFPPQPTLSAGSNTGSKPTPNPPIYPTTDPIVTASTDQPTETTTPRPVDPSQDACAVTMFDSITAINGELHFFKDGWARMAFIVWEWSKIKNQSFLIMFFPTEFTGGCPVRVMQESKDQMLFRRSGLSCQLSLMPPLRTLWPRKSTSSQVFLLSCRLPVEPKIHVTFLMIVSCMQGPDSGCTRGRMSWAPAALRSLAFLPAFRKWRAHCKEEKAKFCSSAEAATGGKLWKDGNLSIYWILWYNASVCSLQTWY